MTFRVVRSRWPRRQRFHFRIVAGNGLILASSETYRDQADCLAAVDLIRQDAADAEVVPWTPGR